MREYGFFLTLYSCIRTQSKILFVCGHMQVRKTPYSHIIRSSRPEVFCKRGVLSNFTKFTGKHLCQSLFLNKFPGLRPATLLKKETLAQVYSCEFCEISKNTFFIEHLWWLLLHILCSEGNKGSIK